ncbi:MAG: hypothetical protein JWL76_1054 [Thermoleophilia bacterium]|nr:hypothetical protein [Thermoleophilia bacterium]
MCRRSLEDPRFRKYPPLPVLACEGFEPRAIDAHDGEGEGAGEGEGEPGVARSGLHSPD